MTLIKMNKEENKYHNWLGVWHGLVLLLMSMAGLLGYRHFAYLPWTEVLVHANYQQITQAELQQMIVACLQHGMLSDSLTAIKQQLVRNPWIKELEIKRAWPGILQLKIVERRLVAIWQDHTLIDDQQQLIALELAKQPLITTLPHLTGNERDLTHVLTSYQQLLPLLRKQGWQISHMERCRGNYFKIQLSTGITLFFMDQELPRQFKRFIQLYPKILQQHGDEPAYIDFRYQHGNFAIK